MEAYKGDAYGPEMHKEMLADLNSSLDADHKITLMYQKLQLVIANDEAKVKPLKQQIKTMETSNLWSLDARDLGKGLVVAIGGAVVAALEDSLKAGSLHLNWAAMGSVALAAGLAYLGKQFCTAGAIMTPKQ